MNRKKLFCLWAAGLFLALAGGCANGGLPGWLSGLGGEKEPALYAKRPIKFPHAKHVEGSEADLACDECHLGALSEDKAGMPSIRLCRNCHDSKEEMEKNLKPFVVDKKALWTEVTAISEDARFSHKVHHDAGVSCETCHRGVKESEAVSMSFRVEKDDCISCHGDKKASAACDTCHQTINRDFRPDTHDQNWKRLHGNAVRARVIPPYENRCELCHQESSCSSCHQEEEPQNHNNFWRIRGHGIAAEIDRDNCATCHRTDYCDRCHRETEPMSHKGGWGEPQDRHCLTCHFPLRSQGCSACHENAEGHLRAPLLPVNITHTTATEGACRTCHGLSLSHYDNGDACRNCHR